MSKDRTALDAAVQLAANKVLLDAMLPALRLAARNRGYAIAVHGSLSRDIDLVAIPWTEGAASPNELVDVLCGALCGAVGSGFAQDGDEWTQKPHGRVAKSIMVHVGGSYVQIDLSVMPRQEK